MDPSKFPTDNLYKFMALSGLGIVALAVVLWWQKSDLFHERLYQRTIEVAQQNERVTQAQQMGEIAKVIMEVGYGRGKIIDNAVAKNAKASEDFKAGKISKEQYDHSFDIYNRDVLEAQQYLKETLPRMESIHQTHEKTIEEGALIKARFEIDTRIADEVDRLRRLAIAAVVFGSLLSAAGFFLWYHKLQKHLDKAVAQGMTAA